MMTSLKDEEFDRLDAFELGFAHLRAYKEEHGNCDVRYRYLRPDGYALGRFVVALRARWNAGDLAPERVELLKEVGLDPDPLATLFNNGIEKLKAFKAEFDHTNVPASYETKDGHPLGKWVILQREGYSAGTLRPEREKALTELGFEFVRDARRARFERGLAALLVFKEREGHFNVPADHSEGDVLLGQWLAHRRAFIKADKAPSYQIKSFENFGVPFSPAGTPKFRRPSFEESLNCLEIFKKKFGHVDVPIDYIADGFKLGEWLLNCRRLKSKNKMPPDRIAPLEQLGVNFDALLIRPLRQETAFDAETRFQSLARAAVDELATFDELDGDLRTEQLVVIVARRIREHFKTNEDVASLLVGLDLLSRASGDTLIDAILNAVEDQVFERATALIHEDERFSPPTSGVGLS
jgi:hypothetical protein